MNKVHGLKILLRAGSALLLSGLLAGAWAQNTGKPRIQTKVQAKNQTDTAPTPAQQADTAQRRAKFLELCRNPTPTQRVTLQDLARPYPIDEMFCNNIAIQFFDIKVTDSSQHTIRLGAGIADRESLPIADLSPFQYFTTITEFTAPSMKVNDVNFLAQNTQMRYLSISSNKITNISFLANLKKLEYLDIATNPLQDDLEPLTHLTALRELSISLQVPRKGFSDLRPLQNLTKFKRLSVTFRNPLSNELDKLRSIESLSLNGPMRDVCVLNHMRELGYLALDSNNLKDVACFQGSRKIRSINIGDNPIKDITPFLPQPHLRALDIRGTLIEDLSAFTDRVEFDSIQHEGVRLRWCSPKTAEDIRKGVSCLNPDGTEKPWWKRALRL